MSHEHVLLVEEIGGVPKMRVVQVHAGCELVMERPSLHGIVLAVREWRCLHDERALGSTDPHTGLRMRLFREVLPPPPPEPVEKPTFDELRVKVELT